MMRTLFVITHIPLPLNVGGNLRPYHLLRALSGVSDVTLVAAAPGNGDGADLGDLRSMCAEVRLFPDATFRWRRERGRRFPRLRGLLQDLDPFEPKVLKSHRSAAAAEILAELSRQAFDVVWIQRLGLLRSLPAFSGRTIVDLDDLEHRKLMHKLKQLPFGRRSLIDALDLVKVRALERSLARGPWETTVCSEVDRAALGDSPRTWIVPNGIDLPRDEPAAQTRSDVPTFVFVGAMFYEPNVDAVRYFAASIFPRLREALPRARFVIVGRDPAPSVRALHDGASVIVTGTVGDVGPFLASASVVVVPLRYGGGTRIKILEALAHRVPVVTTSVGAEGLDVVAGRHAIVADGPGKFARACLEVAMNRALADTLAAEGRRLVEQRYQWSHIEQLVQRIIRVPDQVELAGAPATRSPLSPVVTA